MAESKIATYTINVDTSNGKVKIDGLTKGFIEADAAVNKLKKSTDKLNKGGLNPMISKAGLAGATVTELGRTVSDMNYGFTAVANNISQLSSLFITLISTTGGLKNAFKSILTQLQGPLGLLFAFQLVITMLEDYAMEQERAERKTKSHTDEIKAQKEAMDKLYGSSQASVDRSIELIKLEEDLKDLRASEPESIEKIIALRTKMTKQEILEIKSRIESYRGILTVQQELKLREELYRKERSLSRIRDEEEEKSADDKRDKAQAVKIKGWETTAERLERLRMRELKLMNDNAAENIKVLEYLQEVEKEILKNNEKDIEETYQRRIKMLQEYAMQFGDVLNGLADFFDADFERQLTLEENKTNALNNELRIRLENEKISASERASIQDQIYQNDEKLRKRQEKIEEKRFKMNKAANIANAVINTFLAATGVLAQTKGGAIARIIGMTAVISAGLLQVAAIAKQKFQTSASSAPPSIGGAGGGQSGQQAPDFNIVGSSGVNQLRTAIEGQLNRPIKTYVTTKDVSTGQELDRNIVRGATLGG